MALLIFAGGPERQALASVPSANGASDIPGRGVEAPSQPEGSNVKASAPKHVAPSIEIEGSAP